MCDNTYAFGRQSQALAIVQLFLQSGWTVVVDNQVLVGELLQHLHGNRFVHIVEPVATLLRFGNLADTKQTTPGISPLHIRLACGRTYLPAGPFACEIDAETGDDGRSILNAHRR